MKWTIDFETRSEIDLTLVGPWVYAQHPSTEVFCMAFKEDNKPTGIWVNDKWYAIAHNAGLPVLQKTYDFNAINIVEAHNVSFERAIWENIMVPKFGWPKVPDYKWRCSAAKAASFALPRHLGEACNALGLPIRKDKEGYFVMMKMCKPRRPTKDDKSKWHEDPEDFVKLFKYCINDVDSEYGLSKALPDLSEREHQIWSVDQTINRRGLYVDTEAAQASIDLIAEHHKRMLGEFNKITGLDSPKQVVATIEWLGSKGLKMPNLTKDIVTKALGMDLPADIRRVLEIRKSLAKSSTAKFKAMVAGASADSRMRDTMMYYGAGTGRWAGKRVQPHNMPRKMPDDYEGIIATVKGRDLDSFELFYGDPMPALSGSIRAYISAAPGNDLICADFSSIEGRILAWLAEEEDVVQNYFAGIDAYCHFGSQISGCNYDEILNGYKKEVKKFTEIRFEGKTGELACGYQGGEQAVKRFAPDIPKERREEIVKIWRENRPKTVQFWYDMENYAKSALLTGKVYTWGNIKWGMNGRFLHCKLPSGRLLSYFDPQFREKETPWGEMRKVITYMGVDSKTKKWERQSTYGGKLTENIVQAAARDLLAEALVRFEHNNYPIVLHVHDEAAAEVPEGTGSVEEFIKLMTYVPKWAEGCPIAANGFRTKRYHK